MKFISRIVALAVTATALVATATPAHAVGETTATTTTAYAGGQCVDHPVNYTINLPADAQSYDMRIQPLFPNGEEGVASFVRSMNGQPMTGTVTIQICGGVEPYGTWTLVPTLIAWRDAAGKNYYDPIVGTTSTFEVVGQATTKLTLKGKTKSRKVTARSKLTAVTDGSAAPIASQPVVFQKQVGRKWKSIKSVTTSATGVAKATFKVKGKTKIRARFAGAGEVVVGNPGSAIPAATSKVIRVG